MRNTKLLLAVLVVGLVQVLLSASVCGQSKKKNLLFIMTDQQQYKALSYAGNDVLKTPNLDRLAKSGAFFKNAYTPSAVCAPARSSILTGHTVENTGMCNNEKAYFHQEEGLMKMPTFDEILTQYGYHCEYYGKWHTQSKHATVYQNPKSQSKNGKSIFEHGGQNHVYIDYINKNYPLVPLDSGQQIDKFTQRAYVPDPLDRLYGLNAEEVTKIKKGLSQPNFHGELKVPAQHSFTAFQAKETMDAIERLKDSTFSITCSFHFPHAPMIPPYPYYDMYPADEMNPPASIDDDMSNSPYRSANGRLGLPEYSDPEKIKYMISNYYGLIAEIDHWVGEIISTLDENGLAENTLIIFTSDHGEMLGAHGLREKNVFYEESSHIPLLISLPGEIEEQTQVDGYVSLIDLFPTILDYLDLPQHPSDGRTLRNLIDGLDTEHGKYVVTEWDYRGDVEPNYMIIMDGWKLMIPYSEESEVLNAMYNLHQDPHETNNLLGNNPDRHQYRDKAEELRAQLLEWLEERGSEHYSGVKSRKLI
ncbi:sulfatase-like hydrolase/transferase [Reichenbachiella ulvae]|uniref:Sulfatase-like hydrolase/transferase n=1 Tax=Reichenbachiella ulvae TaxID=2980104 RepID=A0ABT3CP00_9BACT|nr:sulfatase-like hydrolase/transferase [Reichenbachiella ulvae]MCV9385268.1 sulfatase-like hydrolase/transferase [Reichenbachiella ulvae]